MIPLLLTLAAIGQTTQLAPSNKPYYLTAEENNLRLAARDALWQQIKVTPGSDERYWVMRDQYSLLHDGWRNDKNGKVVLIPVDMSCPLRLTPRGQQVWTSMLRKFHNAKKEWHKALWEYRVQEQRQRADDLRGLVE